MHSLCRFICFSAALSCLLHLTSCATSKSTYRDVRLPSPEGGYYVQRVWFTPEQQAKMKKLAKTPGWAGHDCFWMGDDVKGRPVIRISIGEQKVYLLKDGQLVGMSPISSGRESHPTDLGSYKIIEKDKDHKSNLYGSYVDAKGAVVKKDVDVRKDRRPPGTTFDGASMRYFMRVTGAVGMHEGYLPGFAASHGCIRMPGEMAAIFYRESSLGTPVEVVP